MSNETNKSFAAKLLSEVRHSILELATTLNSVKSSSSAYAKFLDHFTSRIPENSDKQELHSVALSMLQETGKMAEKNQELGSHLNNASHKVTELGKYLDTASQEALTDALTGISNRRAFDRQIVSSIEEAVAHKVPLVLLMVDIDDFKKFNDTYGHVVGDQVLCLVARLLVRNIKTKDMGARYGGEEFTILLPATALAGGLIVADRLRCVVESKELIDRGTGNKLGQITLSIGAAEYREGEEVISFIKRVDAALYEAKKAGRNRVCAA